MSAPSHHLEPHGPLTNVPNTPADGDPHRLRRTYREKLGIALLLLYTLTITILRSVRPPNDFAKAHWLLDYRFGFVKRGLVGEILSFVTGLFGMPITASLIFVLSGLALAIFCIVLITMCLRVIRKEAWSLESVLVSIVFLGSPFVVLSAHMIGYYDNIVIVLGILSIVLVLKRRFWLGAGFQVLACLVHEIAITLAFLPFVLSLSIVNTENRKARQWDSPYFIVLPPLVAFFAVIMSVHFFTVPGFEHLLEEHLSQFHFIGTERNELVPLWITMPLSQDFVSQSSSFLERVFSLRMLEMVIPSVIPILLYAILLGRIRDFGARFWSAMLVAVFPLATHAMAWDTDRIWTHTILAGYLVLWIFSEWSEPFGRSSLVRILSVIALVANTAMTIPLLDPVPDRFSIEMRLILLIPIAAGVLWLIAREKGIRKVALLLGLTSFLKSIKADWARLQK